MNAPWKKNGSIEITFPRRRRGTGSIPHWIDWSTARSRTETCCSLWKGDRSPGKRPGRRPPWNRIRTLVWSCIRCIPCAPDRKESGMVKKRNGTKKEDGLTQPNCRGPSCRDRIPWRRKRWNRQSWSRRPGMRETRRRPAAIRASADVVRPFPPSRCRWKCRESWRKRRGPTAKLPLPCRRIRPSGWWWRCSTWPCWFRQSVETFAANSRGRAPGGRADSAGFGWWRWPFVPSGVGTVNA